MSGRLVALSQRTYANHSSAVVVNFANQDAVRFDCQWYAREVRANTADQRSRCGYADCGPPAVSWRNRLNEPEYSIGRCQYGVKRRERICVTRNPHLTCSLNRIKQWFRPWSRDPSLHLSVNGQGLHCWRYESSWSEKGNASQRCAPRREERQTKSVGVRDAERIADEGHVHATGESNRFATTTYDSAIACLYCGESKVGEGLDEDWRTNLRE